MRAVIQRVSEASVKIENTVKGKISKGLLIFIGIEGRDSINEGDIDWLCGKISRLRIFNDKNGFMNLSINDINGEALVISQFTLHASTKKGNRPSYIRSAKPETAVQIYEKFIKTLETYLGKEVQSGEFGAYMEVALVNDGPVTIAIDTKMKE